MLKTAIVGCGKIADQHVAAMNRIEGCELVALCDREVLMARQLGERCGVPQEKCYGELSELLDEVKPDVMHITTPPQGHYPLARQCLEAGSHVYLEKPFTVTAGEAEELIGLAEEKRLNLAAGHNLQFTPEMLEMRAAVARGLLGGRPIHLESHFSYDLGDATYVGPLLANRDHWVRRLPGRLFHNLISHGLAKLAEFLSDEWDELRAWAHQSPRLQDLGGQDVKDELRVFIRDRNGATAFFAFSTQMKPGLNLLRVCGPSQSILVDHASGSMIRLEDRPAKSYLTFLLPPLRMARQHSRCARRNFAGILRRRLYQDAGMKELIERFYRSIETGAPPPLPYREILLTARMMDEIFRQVYPSREIGEVDNETDSQELEEPMQAPPRTG